MLLAHLLDGLPPWLMLGMGTAVGWVRNFWNFLYNHTVGWLLNKFKVEFTIEEMAHPEAFAWVNLWMEKHLRTRKISSLRLQRDLVASSDCDDKEDVRHATGYNLLPAYGTYYLRWRGMPLVFNSFKEKNETPTGGGSSLANFLNLRTVTLTLWGTRDRRVLLDILKEAHQQFDKLNPRQMRYYTHGDGGWWESNILIDRPMETVYLPERQMADILTDFEAFFAAKEKYRSLGVPWRHGYLLEGPPGGGKSTLVQALSSHFRIPVYYLNLGIDLTPADLIRLVRNVRPPSILLIEDVDCIGAAEARKVQSTRAVTPGRTNEKPPAKIQTSDLLNVLDGLVASEERLVILTTNHPENLDPALARKGRVDRIFHIGYAQDTELKRFHARARSMLPVVEWAEFRMRLPAERATIADAQALVLHPAEEVEEAVGV